MIWSLEVEMKRLFASQALTLQHAAAIEKRGRKKSAVQPRFFL
jgi:hypothetical protein